MPIKHSLQTAIHKPYAAVYADSVARLAATGFIRAEGGGVVAFDSTDLYKIVLQLDDASEWVLTATTPAWVQISGAGSLANDSITNAKLANMAQATIKGRAAGAGTGDPTDLTGTQATAVLDAMVGDSGAGGTKGLAPAPAAGDAAANKFLKANGSWATVPGGTGGVGDVVGPGSATDNALARFDSTTGKLIQDSPITLDDTGAITVPEMAAPSTPAAGKVAVYAKSDGKLYIKDDAGAETDLTGTGGGGTPGGADTQVQYNNAGAFGGITGATSNGTTLTITSPNVVTGINDTNGNPVISITPTGSAVNGLNVTNGATGSGVDLATSGSDANINLTLSPKGTGQTTSAKVIGVTSSGVLKVHFQSSGLGLASTSNIQWSNSGSSTGTVDLGLARSAAGILEINNGSTPNYRWLKKAGEVRATPQFDKTNTTLADVTGTAVALLNGQTYAFEFEANYDADATGGQKWAIAYSSTTSSIEYHIKSLCDASGLLVITSRQTASAGSAGQAGCIAGRVRICGTLTTTGAGNLTVQFAQNAANGTSSVRTGGSFFRVWPTTN